MNTLDPVQRAQSPEKTTSWESALTVFAVLSALIGWAAAYYLT
jgi:hypothetical protein